MELLEDFPGMVIRYPKALTQVRNMIIPTRSEMPKVFWFWGVSGSGKSHSAREKAIEIAGSIEEVYYQNTANQKWWDGYSGQKVVVLDELRPGIWNLQTLLRLFDKYPLQVETKGGMIKFNSPYIFVTSCFGPSDFALGENEVQLQRRLSEVRFFKTRYSGTEVEGNTVPQPVYGSEPDI